MEREYPNPRPITVDLFCGAGGLSLGMEQAGFDVALGVDLDGHHVATHERNFPCGKSLCASVVDLDGDRIRSLLGDGRDVDALVGGPPCQGFSFMGLRDAKDPRNSLIDHFARIVLELRPKTFAMENVPGLLAGKTRGALDRLIEAFRSEGYRVALPVRVLDAADFGVPQHRRRMFLLGVRRDVADRVAYPRAKCPGQPERPTVSEAIADLPDVDAVESLYRENDAPYPRRPKSPYARVARGLADDPSDLSHPRKWNASLCTGCLRTRHAPKSAKLYAATPPGEMVPGHKLPRLDPNGICPTLRAGSDSAHGSYTAPRPVHPTLPRCITAREAARLHGFPDWFAFYPLKWHACRQIGNAVCPPVGRAIGYALRAAIGGKTASDPPPAIALGGTFLLPDDRPRTLKRIPHMRQFPPVVAHLFAAAYDARRKRLRKAAFTFADVSAAIRATGVDLHWVREETFLREIARSRRVKEILASTLDRGYSIVECREDGAIGKFVPAGTPGTLEDKETLRVRIDDIHGAEELHLRSVRLHDRGSDGATAVAVLSEASVQKVLWRGRKYEVSLLDGRHACREGSFLTALLKGPNAAGAKKTPVLMCKSKALPNKARLRKIAAASRCDTIAVLAVATREHLVAMRFDDCRSGPREVARAAFKLL